MAGEDTGAERTQDATPKKIADARRKGDVARSRELDTAIMLTAGLIGLAVFGPGAVRLLLADSAGIFAMERAQVFEPETMPRLLLAMLFDALWAITPLLCVTFLAALSGPVFMGGFLMSGLKMDFKRLDPLKGIARMFSVKSLVELLKSIAKVLLCILAAWLVGRFALDGWMAIGRAPLVQALTGSFRLVFAMLVALTLVMVIVAIGDVPWQKFQHARKLRMTLEEVRREHKESDGNPEVKSKRRSEQMRISQLSMLSDVTTANVIITNPTHFAVALRYREGDEAPTLVARGVDELAQRIRAIGIEAGVRQVAAPPLARALYHHTRVGQTVRTELWEAVAQVLAFVVQLDRVAGARRVAGQRLRTPTPPTSADLAVPTRLSDPPPFATGDVDSA